MSVVSDFKARTNPWLLQMEDVETLIEILSDPIQDTRDALAYLIAIENIDDAEGEQLDHRGGWIGVKRPMLEEDDDNVAIYFELGSTEDPDNSQGYEEDDGSGGYYADIRGLNSITNPGVQISDADYRRLIKAKAKTFFQKATIPNIFTFLLTFGARCLIHDDTARVLLYEAAEFDDLTDWERWYASTKGFKPGGISVDFMSRLTDKEYI